MKRTTIMKMNYNYSNEYNDVSYTDNDNDSMSIDTIQTVVSSLITYRMHTPVHVREQTSTGRIVRPNHGIRFPSI